VALYTLPSLVAKLSIHSLIYRGFLFFFKFILPLLCNIFTKAFSYTNLDSMEAWKHFPSRQINVFFLSNESGKLFCCNSLLKKANASFSKTKPIISKRSLFSGYFSVQVQIHLMCFPDTEDSPIVFLLLHLERGSHVNIQQPWHFVLFLPGQMFILSSRHSRPQMH